MFFHYIKQIFICLFFIYPLACLCHPSIEHSQVDQKFSQFLLQEIHLKGNEKILDIGCGDGRISLELAKKVPQGKVIGVEPSPSMINKAKSLHQSTDVQNISFVQGNAETFAINQKFDIVIAIHVMHWIKDQNQALQNIYAHLAPNGKVYFMMAPSKEDLPFERALNKTIKSRQNDFANFKNPMHLYDIETYRKLMVNSGFHIDNICYTFYQEDFANKQDFANWLKQWLPHYKFLPFNKKEAFLNVLIDNYLSESTTEHKNKINWGEYIVTLEATKPITNTSIIKSS